MSSWESVHQWYDQKVGDEGHYYHQTIVVPGSLDLLRLKKGHSLLDLACGQGVLARSLPPAVSYTGLDISKQLIHAAKSRRRKEETYLVADITKPLPVEPEAFTHAVCMLALQNVKDPGMVFKGAAAALKKGGVFLAILNHPCFRIPRQTSWGYDEKAKVQYRRLDRYLSPLEIPILMHPGKKNSPTTFSYHYPLSTYTRLLADAGLYIDAQEEWCSNKESEGGRARAENRARNEFPLFLAVRAKKL